MSQGVTKLNKLLASPKITEIMINGIQGVWLEEAGQKRKIEVDFNEEEINQVIEEFFNKQGKKVSYYNPYEDVCTQDGSRINVITYPLAKCGTTITIRKFDRSLEGVDDLVRLGTLSPKMAEFLIACIKGGVNILFSGATGSGKTTTLEKLSYHIPEQERVITVEDTAELRLHHKNLVPLETRAPDKEGKNQVTLGDLIRNSLRMRPDRLIVGEVRGSEAFDMIQAMSTGHRGTLAVIHANSPQEVASRMETLIFSSGIQLPVFEIRKIIGYTLNLIVQQERSEDGIRRITHISEARGIERNEVALQDLFRFTREGKGDDGKLKGSFHTVMRNYPLFFTDFYKRGLLDDKIFKE